MKRGASLVYHDVLQPGLTLPIGKEVERRLSLHLLADQPVKRAAAGDNVIFSVLFSL